MKRLTQLVCVLLLLSAGTAAEAQVAVDEALTIDATAGGVALASATRDPAGRRQAVYCTGVLETGQIRMLDNGDAPTTTVGTLVDIGATIELFQHNYIAAARFIRTTSTSGAVHFTCYPEYPPWVRQ